MDRAHALLDQFAQHAVRRSGTLYFCRRTTLEIIDRCEQLGLPLAGIDGFFLTDTRTHQPLEWILDMSEAPSDYAAARRFVEAGAALPLFYELFLAGEPPDAQTRASQPSRG
ncbi:MAG: hypothetical protein IT536_18260 [Hyphomicrobiales bacterium]|nr:hypothetical protein [Hyphomicrobiales bacterium]